MVVGVSRSSVVVSSVVACFFMVGCFGVGLVPGFGVVSGTLWY